MRPLELSDLIKKQIPKVFDTHFFIIPHWFSIDEAEELVSLYTWDSLCIINGHN